MHTTSLPQTCFELVVDSEMFENHTVFFFCYVAVIFGNWHFKDNQTCNGQTSWQTKPTQQIDKENDSLYEFN